MLTALIAFIATMGGILGAVTSLAAIRGFRWNRRTRQQVSLIKSGSESLDPTLKYIVGLLLPEDIEWLQSFDATWLEPYLSKHEFEVKEYPRELGRQKATVRPYSPAEIRAMSSDEYALVRPQLLAQLSHQLGHVHQISHQLAQGRNPKNISVTEWLRDKRREERDKK